MKTPPSKPKFMAGFNAGSRHEKERITPPSFHLSDKSNEFKAGYSFGIADRRAGKLTDNDAATVCINEAFRIYQASGTAPVITL